LHWHLNLNGFFSKGGSMTARPRTGLSFYNGSNGGRGHGQEGSGQSPDRLGGARGLCMSPRKGLAQNNGF
jgi:hypothetical protein